MAIVWPCPVSVDVYAAAGRGVVAPRVACPSCLGMMGFWSGYERTVRAGCRDLRVWLVRARCSPCGVSHALVPSFLLVGRLNVVDTIGGVLAAVASGRSVGRVAADVDVPYTTARGWVRRFRDRAGVMLSGFAALTVELGGDVGSRWPRLVVSAAVAAIICAHRAAVVRHEVLTPGVWAFVSLVTGGMLIRANTDSPWRVFGSRRFIPPIPSAGS